MTFTPKMLPPSFESWREWGCKPVDQEKLSQAIIDHGSDVVKRVQVDIDLRERAEYGRFVREYQREILQ